MFKFRKEKEVEKEAFFTFVKENTAAVNTVNALIAMRKEMVSQVVQHRVVDAIDEQIIYWVAKLAEVEYVNLPEEQVKRAKVFGYAKSQI